jgi:preprotein translocase subunit SecD
MSQRYSGLLALVVSVLLIALLAILWLKPKRGIDIMGGTILLYDIKSGGQPANASLPQEMIAILKQRVDPSGTRDLVWIGHGSNQIEIQVPAAGGEEADAQKQLDQARAELEATNIHVSDATDAIEGKDGKTLADLDPLADGSPDRTRILDAMKAAFAKVKMAEATRDVASGFAAREDYDELKAELAKTNKSTMALEAVFRRGEPRLQQLQALNAEWPNWPARVQALNDYEAAETKLAQLARSGDAPLSLADLKQMLRGSGVLEFHILPRDNDSDLAKTGGYAAWKDRLLKDGPRYRTGDDFKWFEVQDPDEFKGRGTVKYDDRTWILASVKAKDSLDRQSGDWHLKNARQGADQTGQFLVEFQFDTLGGDKFGILTRDHVGDPMAIMLNDQVISAPVINSPILTGSGEISGGSNGFTNEQAEYPARACSAAWLDAQQRVY